MNIDFRLDYSGSEYAAPKVRLDPDVCQIGFVLQKRSAVLVV